MSYRRNTARRRSRSAERYRRDRKDNHKRRARTPSESSSVSRDRKRRGRSYSSSSSSYSSSRSSNKSSLLSELSAVAKPKPLYLRLSNLSRNVTHSVLTDICSHFGEPRSIDFVPFPGSKKLKGVAYIQFASSDEARAALECLAPSKADRK